MSKPDWTTIENEYITTKTTYEQLAKKYKVSRRSIERHSKKNDWQAKKNTYVGNVSDLSRKMSEETEAERIVAVTKRFGDTANEILLAITDDIKKGKLKPQDIRALTSAMKDAQATFHLAYGKPTTINQVNADPEAQKDWEKFTEQAKK